MSVPDYTSKSVPFGLISLSGGLNSNSSGLALQDNETPDCLNVDFDIFGSSVKRNGYAVLNTTAFNGGAVWNSLYWFELSSGVDKLIGTCGNKIGKMDDLDGTWDDITESGAVAFTGTGLDDAESGGTYTGNGHIEYKVVIDGEGTPDTFEWFKDGVSEAAGVAITGAAQTLDNGLTIEFAATTGHTSGDQWVFYPPTTITAGNNNFMRWRTFLDTAIGTNNVNRLVKWTGTGNARLLTTVTGLTKSKFLEIFNAYTILANVTVSATAHPSRVYWSTINTIETWDSADFADIARNDGTEITGLKVLGDKLVIFKERSVWIGLFTGDADIPFQFIKTPSHVGCISGDSIQEISNGLKFLASDGFYYFDGANSTKMSDKVSTTLELFAKGRLEHVQSAFQKVKNRYWAAFTLSGKSENERCMTFDSINLAYSIYSGHNANCFAIVNTAGEERIYFGDYKGYVYRADSGTSDNPEKVQTAIDSYYYTKWFSFNDLVDVKGIPCVYIYHQLTNSTLRFSYSYDFENADTYSQSFSLATSSAVYGSAQYDIDVYAASGGSFKRRDLTGRGRLVRLKFANNIIGQTFQIDGIGILGHLETYK